METKGRRKSSESIYGSTIFLITCAALKYPLNIRNKTVKKRIQDTGDSLQYCCVNTVPQNKYSCNIFPEFLANIGKEVYFFTHLRMSKMNFFGYSWQEMGSFCELKALSCLAGGH